MNCGSYAEIFSKHATDIGKTNLAQINLIGKAFRSQTIHITFPPSCLVKKRTKWPRKIKLG